MTKKSNINCYFNSLARNSTLLRHLNAFARMPFDRRGKFEFRNGHWLQAAVERSQNFIRRDRNFMDPDSDRVVNGVRHRRYDRQERPLTGFFRAVGSFRIVGFDQNRFDLGGLQRRRALVLQDGWNLVQTVFAEDLLFHQRLAESHINAAFGLTFHEQRIERTSTVVSDPNFIYFNFARDAVTVKLDDRRSKTISRRGTNSGAFEVPWIFWRPVAAGGAQRSVFALRLPHRVSETHAALGKARATNLAVGELDIVQRHFQRLARSFEQPGIELAAKPMPWPKGSLPNFFFHPARSATRSMHSRSPVLLTRKPFTVTLLGSTNCFKRKSMGSMPSFSAISSSWISIAKRGCGVPWPRFGPQAGLFVKTRSPSNL